MRAIGEVFGTPDNEEPLCRWLPFDSFVDDGVYSLKTGGIAMGLEYEGVEYETQSQAQLEKVSGDFAAAQRVFDERFRVYHHWCKTDDERVAQSSYEDPIVDRAQRERKEFVEGKGLHRIRIFSSIIYEADPVKTNLSLDVQQLSRDQEIKLAQNIETLKEAVAGYASTMGKLLGVRRLDRAGVYEQLDIQANPERTLVLAPHHNERIDYAVGNTGVHQRSKHLDWGDYKTRVFALKEEPDRTFANILRGLLQIESRCIFTYEFKRVSNLTMMQMIRRKRKKTWGQRKAKEGSIADKASTEKANRLNEALAEIQFKGNYFGDCSLLMALYDGDEKRLRRSVTKLREVFQNHEATILEEHWHRMRSFFAMLPGNHHLNLRYRYLTNRNYADLAPIYKTNQGSIYNAHLDGEYLTVLETLEGTPYYLNLHVGQVAATLIAGGTGSGKSLLINRLIEDSQKYEGQITVICDVGGSYRGLTKKYGGTYISVSLNDKGFGFAPFQQPQSKEAVADIKALMISLFQNAPGFVVSTELEQELENEIWQVYGLPEHKRRIGAISLPKEARRAIYMWINEGTYAHLFDNAYSDINQIRSWVTFDYTAVEKHKGMIGPLMDYQMSWVKRMVQDPRIASRPKAMWLDEAWRFGGTALMDGAREAAKTWRKYNAWIVFSTQDPDVDADSAANLKALNSACLTKIFLGNGAGNLKDQGAIFGLSDRELELIGEVEPGEFLVKVRHKSRRLRLRESPSRLEEYQSQFSELTT